MTVSQIQNHKWPVVGQTNGALAVKTIKRNWDYVNGFDEIILMFDMDAKDAVAVADVTSR